MQTKMDVCVCVYVYVQVCDLPSKWLLYSW